MPHGCSVVGKHCTKRGVQTPCSSSLPPQLFFFSPSLSTLDVHHARLIQIRGAYCERQVHSLHPSLSPRRITFFLLLVVFHTTDHAVVLWTQPHNIESCPYALQHRGSKKDTNGTVALPCEQQSAANGQGGLIKSGRGDNGTHTPIHFTHASA
jgi:hypothetical protein